MTPAEQLFWSEVAALLQPMHAAVGGLAPILAAYTPMLITAAVVAFGVVLLAESTHQVASQRRIVLDTASGLD
ncbi:MAG: hypothetical protein GVY18_14070 [Bacteroidetes bacterium]|nr:hypothetical protein [Bacteroidota bacterium]